MRNLYAGQEATVRAGHGTTNWFQIGKGTILSPCLFDLYAENIMRNTAGVQPRLIQGIRSGDGVGDLFNYLFIKDIKSNRIRIAQ